MKKVYQNLYICNDQFNCWDFDATSAVVHACKHPCHCKALNYKNRLEASHPNYLVLERDNHLVLNMVDMDKELDPKFTNPMLQAAMSFIERFIVKNKLLIHCNKGQSRSPSIALLYLARIKAISASSFEKAEEDFRLLYPLYTPGNGIRIYMKKNWATLLAL